MDFSISSLASSFLFSTIGFFLLREAKKKANLKLIPIAIALMVYTYFTNSPILDWGIGFGLCGLAWFVINSEH